MPKPRANTVERKPSTPASRRNRAKDAKRMAETRRIIGSVKKQPVRNPVYTQLQITQTRKKLLKIKENKQWKVPEKDKRIAEILNKHLPRLGSSDPQTRAETVEFFKAISNPKYMYVSEYLLQQLEKTSGIQNKLIGNLVLELRTARLQHQTANREKRR